MATTTAATNEDPLLDTAAVAAAVGQKPATVHYWRHVGKGPSWRKVDGRVRYRSSDVVEWLRERDVSGGSQ